MSATIPSNKQLDDLLKSTGFDCPESLKGKTFNEATSGGGEDKLLCYWSDRSSVTCCIVYTDKPATKLSYQRQGAPEGSVFPCDEGRHLFLAPATIANGTFSLHLVYVDGSSSADLRDKLVQVR